MLDGYLSKTSRKKRGAVALSGGRSLAALRHHRSTHGISSSRSRPRPGRPPTTWSAPRTDCEGGNFFGAAGNGAIGLSILTGKGIGPRATITKEIVDGLHGVALAYSFSFTEVKNALTGSFGQNGPKSADPMLFQVKASFLDDGPGKVPCGSLAGKNPSRVAGIPATWTPNASGTYRLDYLGTITCGAGCKATGSNGVATLRFQPDDECLPGVGSTIFQHGTVVADANPQQAAGNILGSVAEALGFTKDADFGWDIGYHDTGGYRVEIPPIVETQTATGELSVTYSETENCRRPDDLPHPTRPRPSLGADEFSRPFATWQEQDHIVTPEGSADTDAGPLPTVLGITARRLDTGTGTRRKLRDRRSVGLRPADGARSLHRDHKSDLRRHDPGDADDQRIGHTAEALPLTGRRLTGGFVVAAAPVSRRAALERVLCPGASRFPDARGIGRRAY